MCDRGAGAPADCSRDAIGRGRLTLWQPRFGYRFSVDALLLAHFALPERPSRSGRAVDLGAGCGVIGLALARATPDLRVTLVELQPRLAALCGHNAATNALAARVEVCEADLRQPDAGLPGAAYAVALSNPPFYPAGAGRESPDPERALAQSERALSLEALVAAAARLLQPGGVLCVVYPAERLPALLSACAGRDLRPTRLQMVHPRPRQPARRVLLAARKGGGRPLKVAPPLVVHGSEGVYSAEAEAILDGAWMEG